MIYTHEAQERSCRTAAMIYTSKAYPQALSLTARETVLKKYLLYKQT